MKAVWLGVVLVLVLFSGCAQLYKDFDPQRDQFWPYTKSLPERIDNPVNEPPKRIYVMGSTAAIPTPSPRKPSTPSPTPATKPVSLAAVPKPSPRDPVPVARPVEGKKGKVFSPYVPNSIVDVEGFPPGSTAVDPYVKKPFLIPVQ